MGRNLRPFELAREYLCRPGKLRETRNVEEKFSYLLDELKGKDRLDPSDEILLDLAFYTALMASGVSSSQLRRVYTKIIHIRDESKKVMEGRRDWKDVVAALVRARIFLTYTMGRQKKDEKRQFLPLYRVLDEALDKTEKTVRSVKEDERRVERANSAIEALCSLAQGILAFHKFLNEFPREYLKKKERRGRGGRPARGRGRR